ncbi:MAG: single-stranded DNA-binding protein [Candidatus Marinimicrobia bacterium]|nr:single-stranded DNA-binding protein [Candidatus Neomarinimicrobiota bacterium]
MSASLNKVILAGNLVRDLELRKTPNGTSVVDMRLAIDDSYRNARTNETIERTCFVDVVVWGRQAENCEKYLRKGSPVLVEGRLQTDSWETKEGEKRSKLLVTADRVQFLSGGGGGGGRGERGGQPEHDRRAETGAEPTGGGRSDDAEPWSDDDNPPADSPF